jgi:hypothetical protein
MPATKKVSKKSKKQVPVTAGDVVLDPVVPPKHTGPKARVKARGRAATGAGPASQVGMRDLSELADDEDGEDVTQVLKLGAKQQHQLRQENVMEKGGKGDDKVVATSLTEPAVIKGTQKVLHIAEEISARWREREARDSVVKFQCPFCTPSQVAPFDTKKEAERHIKQYHPRQVEMFKLQKRSKDQYTPREVTISPKRTIADVVPIELAGRMQQIQAVHDQMKPIRDRGLQLAQKDLRASSLLMMPESVAEQKVQSLSNDQLKEAGRLAVARGKNSLLRRIRTIARERHVSLPI